MATEEGAGENLVRNARSSKVLSIFLTVQGQGSRVLHQINTVSTEGIHPSVLAY